MLTRRETLTTAVIATSGTALLAPLERWLGVQPGRLPARTESTERIGMADVAVIERATRYFATTDADIGGALSREAAVASYTDAVAHRALNLAGDTTSAMIKPRLGDLLDDVAPYAEVPKVEELMARLKPAIFASGRGPGGAAAAPQRRRSGPARR